MVNDFMRTRYPDEAILDFHDRGVLYPGEIEIMLDEFIVECKSKSIYEILIITGKGAVVRPTVKSYLGKHKDVETFKTADYFNGGEGALEVIIK